MLKILIPLFLIITTANAQRNGLLSLNKDKVYDAFYKLESPREQITSYIFDLVRAEVPKMILDDVFEKLDDNRMQQLLHWVCNENEGQVLITDTHRERLQDAFEKLNTAYQIIEL